jgi:uncharacterized membrane protein YraQ (UPF0718 family)
MSLDSLVNVVWRSLGKVEKSMILLTLFLYIASALYSSTTREKVVKSVEVGGSSLVRISLLLLSGMFLGSFVGTFLPKEFVSQLLGQESGFYGILLGTIFGSAMPGGPYVLFPIVSSLYSSGASVPPLIAMIFAWQCISLTRIPTDLGYLAVVEGERLVWMRVILGIPVPIIAGFLASVIWRVK